MNNDIPELDIYNYMQGHLMADAIYEFGNPELIKSLNVEFDAAAPRQAPLKAGTFLEGLAIATGGLQALSQLKDRRLKIQENLKIDILNLIRKGDLIIYGFKEPRNMADKPIKIPADLFFTGELNWDNSELKYKTNEFSGIRLFKDISPIIDLQPENQNKKLPEIQDNKKSKNINDQDPSLHIDEKLAAEYLGISFGTLQGYRTKGGGPEFIKIGKKTVRYKIQDLIDWADNHKKKNTSQY